MPREGPGEFSASLPADSAALSSGRDFGPRPGAFACASSPQLVEGPQHQLQLAHVPRRAAARRGRAAQPHVDQRVPAAAGAPPVVKCRTRRLRRRAPLLRWRRRRGGIAAIRRAPFPRRLRRGRARRRATSGPPDAGARRGTPRRSAAPARSDPSAPARPLGVRDGPGRPSKASPPAATPPASPGGTARGAGGRRP